MAEFACLLGCVGFTCCEVYVGLLVCGLMFCWVLCVVVAFGGYYLVAYATCICCLSVVWSVLFYFVIWGYCL